MLPITKKMILVETNKQIIIKKYSRPICQYVKNLKTQVQIL